VLPVVALWRCRGDFTQVVNSIQTRGKEFWRNGWIQARLSQHNQRRLPFQYVEPRLIHCRFTFNQPQLAHVEDRLRL
jgi:hypothetical protein